MPSWAQAILLRQSQSHASPSQTAPTSWQRSSLSRCARTPPAADVSAVADAVATADIAVDAVVVATAVVVDIVVDVAV